MSEHLLNADHLPRLDGTNLIRCPSDLGSDEFFRKMFGTFSPSHLVKKEEGVGDIITEMRKLLLQSSGHSFEGWSKCHSPQSQKDERAKKNNGHEAIEERQVWESFPKF
jgi:hypothetical protein